QVQAAFDANAIGLLGVPGPSGNPLSLDRVSPNPARDDLSVAFTLPASGDVSIEVVDLAGRRVGQRAVPALDAGPHVLAFTGATAGLRPGVYFVRLREGNDSVTRRVALSR